MSFEMLWLLEPVVLTAYTGCMVLLLVYVCGQLHLLRAGQPQVKTVKDAPSTDPIQLPFVTVQLPVYNEQYVVERLVEAVGRLDYPRDKFEIQLLDDSTDSTTAIAARALWRLAKQGVQVSHVRREDRKGFKAGALRHGMTVARGEFIAVFDADFLPKPDFLQRTLGYFRDSRVAVVQTRWGHLNEHTSLMTRMQAFLLSLHFRFEQPYRARADLFLNFNGTCGIWRAEAIGQAGGWKARTITEDIDLSYRAQLQGWKICYLDDYETPGELPEEMSGFRTQQYRWMKGSAQNAKIHLKRMLNSGLPFHVRWHGVQHLLSGSVYVLIFGALLLSTPLAMLKNRMISYDYVDFGLPFLCSTVGMFWVFHTAQSPRPSGVGGHVRFVGMMILFLIFTMGLSVHNGLAVVSGWVGRQSAFIRTPKYGDGPWTLSAYVKRTIDPKVLCDLAMLVYLLFGLYIGWHRGQYAFFSLQLMGVFGLIWVTTLSLIHPLKALFEGDAHTEFATRQEVTS